MIKHKFTSFSRRLSVTAALLVVLAITFGIYVWTEKQTDAAHRLRYQSFLLADQLRQSSDDLTRMMRLYVETGNPVYKQYYQAIIDIRDGKKIRPSNYQGIYWDFILAGQQKALIHTTFSTKVCLANDTSIGGELKLFIEKLTAKLLPWLSEPCFVPQKPQALSFLSLMHQIHVTQAEFNKLDEAKNNSDALVKIEIIAMSLIESPGADVKASQDQARLMMHDDKYHQHKAAIMRPIEEFFVLLDRRTSAMVRAAEIHAIILRYVFVLLGFALMTMLWRTYVALRLTLGGSVDEVYLQIAEIGSGNFNSAITVGKGMENSVLGWLAETQIKLKTIDHERAEATKKVVLAHKRLHDSIEYASLIQKAILPSQQLADYLGEYHCVLWHPLDVVGGDFYVFHADEENYLLGVIDCAGHGVPGALMTMLARAALDQAIAAHGINSPATLLKQMDSTLREMLKNTNMPRGLAITMDAGLAFIAPVQQRIIFAGAKMSLYWTNGEQVAEIKGKNRSVLGNKKGDYEDRELAIEPDMTFCITSDGVLDQTGGLHGFGLGNNAFTELLCQYAGLSPAEQGKTMMDAIHSYQGNYPQRDDITILFFKPKHNTEVFSDASY
jgi:serine phosphatase RsbU (regulator of sigma subunit)